MNEMMKIHRLKIAANNAWPADAGGQSGYATASPHNTQSEREAGETPCITAKGEEIFSSMGIHIFGMEARQTEEISTASNHECFYAYHSNLSPPSGLGHIKTVFDFILTMAD